MAQSRVWFSVKSFTGFPSLVKKIIWSKLSSLQRRPVFVNDFKVELLLDSENSIWFLGSSELLLGIEVVVVVRFWVIIATN